MIKNFNKTKYNNMTVRVEDVYAFTFLLIGNNIEAEKITVESVIESCRTFTYTVNFEQCLHAAYRKGVDTCSLCGYKIHDNLSQMLSKLTYLERSLILLRYRYYLTDKVICRIVRKRKPEVHTITRQALTRMMRDNSDEYINISDCKIAKDSLFKSNNKLL